MPIFETEQYKKGKSFAILPFGIRLLGQIALNGKISDSLIQSISKNKTGELSKQAQIKDLLDRKIIERKDNTFTLGKFGPGHCNWIFGRSGKPIAITDSAKAREIRKKRTANKKPAKKGKTGLKLTTGRPPNPEFDSIPLRPTEKQQRINRAIRNRRRLP